MTWVFPVTTEVMTGCGGGKTFTVVNVSVKSGPTVPSPLPSRPFPARSVQAVRTVTVIVSPSPENSVVGVMVRRLYVVS